MEVSIVKSRLAGQVRIPASKSHSIRALLIAALAEGTSRLGNVLDSQDVKSCISACRALGAVIRENGNELTVKGTGGIPSVPENVIDVGNSGTTLYLTASIAALAQGWCVFTGDDQIRRRPVENLLQALRDLGVEAFTTRENGCAPFIVKGPLKGGQTTIECPTSQYLTSLLLSAPLAAEDTEIIVPLLHERPYVEMTLSWLEEQGIRVERDDFRRFLIPGGQHYTAFEKDIPADFSSATFFLAAAAVTGSTITLQGLDMNDTQGDKAVIPMLEKLGCRVSNETDGITIAGGTLSGCELDLNATPDALPALAAVACYAKGETRLVNVPQARLKETDRISVMAAELAKMGADVTELPDGLVIRGGRLEGKRVSGRHDHRIVMALAVAGLGAEGTTIVETAEAASVTFPQFFTLLESLGPRSCVSA